MARVLITNAYSARNRGDAAIILGMIEALRRTPSFADAEIVVSTVDHPADAASYPARTAPSFHSLKNRISSNATANLLYFVVALLPMSLLWSVCWRLGRFDLPLPEGLRGLLREYAAADVVVAAGGGYLYTTSAVHGNLVLLTNLYCFYVAVLMGKPVVLWAQSIGPFAGWWQASLVRRALVGVDAVEVREGVSARLVGSWRLATPARTVADAAFLLEARSSGPGRAFPGDGPTVGMTVRRWFRDARQQDRYEKTIAEFVRWLVDERNASVVFLPQVTFRDGHDDDRETARSVAARAASDERVHLIEDEVSAAEIRGICSRFDLFVGTRMHSNIFALSSGVPALAIAYQPKTLGIMASLGLDAYVVPIEGLAVGALQEAFDRLSRDGETVRDHLRRAIPEAEACAALGGRVVADVLAGGDSDSRVNGGVPRPGRKR